MSISRSCALMNADWLYPGAVANLGAVVQLGPVQAVPREVKQVDPVASAVGR